MYNDKVKDYFKNPRNMGQIDHPDGIGEVGNPICGDMMKLYIKVNDQKLEDLKFETLGCVAAVATSSMITVLARGKTLEQALKITKEEVADALGGLPPGKMVCSNLSTDALREAIANYNSKHKN